jgi:hypothetical protein
LLNVHVVSVVRQKEKDTAGELVCESSPFVTKIAVGKLKRYKSSVIDLIPAELIQAGGETLRSEIHKLNDSICNREELPDQ